MSLTLIHPEMSYQQFLKEWLKEKEKEVAKSTLGRYKNRIKVHIQKGIGDFGLEEIDEDVIQDFIDEMYKEFPEKYDTIRDVYLIINTSLERAKNHGIIPENPAERISIPKPPHKSSAGEIVFWNDNEIKAYLDALSGHKQFFIIYMILAEGLQQGESLALGWDDIDFSSKTIQVRNTLSRDGKEVVAKTVANEEGRSANTREIKVENETINMLQQELSEQKKSGVPNPLGLVNVTANGTPIMPKNLSRLHHQYCKKAGVPKNNFRDLRHIYTLSALKKGVHPLYLAEKLGYSDMRFLRTYEQFLSDKEKRYINKISEKAFNRNIFTTNV